MTATRLALLALLLVSSGPIHADDASVSPEEARRLWLSRLDGQRFTARMTLRIHRGGTVDERRFEVFRDDQEVSRERVMVRFESPFDMRGFSLLYLENRDRPNDYFVYQPAGRRVRRVQESMARQDVYGVDLEYLAFGVALVEPTEVESVSEQVLDGVAAVRLTEKAIRDNQRFDRRVVWLDPQSWIPLKTEHLRQGRTRLVARTEEIREIQGVLTPVRATFERPLDGERVVMTVDAIDYRAPIPEAFFSTLRLIQER